MVACMVRVAPLAQGVPVHRIAVYIVLGSQGHRDFKVSPSASSLGTHLSL